MAQKTPLVRLYRCQDCGDEDEWTLEMVPAEYICLCGGEMRETENSKKAGREREGGDMSTSIVDLGVGQIIPSRWQPRSYPYDGDEFEELKASVKRNGILNRLRVFTNENNEYELITGHRRLAAAKAVELALVPAEVVADLSRPMEGDELENQLRRIHEEVIVDNLHHQDLTHFEQANAIEALMDDQGYGQEEAGHVLGRSQQWVSDRLSLLKLAPAVQTAVTAGAVEFSTARKLAKLPADVQAPVMERVKDGDAESAARVVGKISAALKPEFWELPEGPRGYDDLNKQRLLAHWLLEAEEAQHGQGKLLAMLERADILKPAHELAEWNLQWLKPRLETLVGKELPSWPEFAKDRGMVCESCLWSEHKPFWQCKSDDETTCLRYLGPDDKVFFDVPDKEARDCIDCLEDEGGCTDATCHVVHREDKVEQQEAGVDEIQQQRRAKAQEQIKAFHDRQQEGDGDLDHWAAQACKRCVSFRSVAHPEGPCGFEGTYIGTHIWTDGDGAAIPRCSQYVLGDVSFIAQMSQKSTREILIAQLKLLRQRKGSALGWLPCDDSVTALSSWLKSSDLSLRQLGALVTMGLNEDRVPWQGSDEKFKQINPITGEYETWQRLVEETES